MRILYVNHGSVIGGAETNLLNILRFAPVGGFEPVGVILPNQGPLETEVRRLGIAVGHVDYHAFSWHNPTRYMRTLAQLVAWIHRTRPAIIHLNHQWLVSHIVQAGRLTRTPVVCHTRNYLDETFVTSHQYWLCRAQSVVVLSKTLEHRAFDLGIPVERIRLIYDGIDCGRFQLVASHPRRQSVQKGPVIGFIGRVVAEKGPEDLIAALPLVLKMVPDVRCCFLGDDQDGGMFIDHLRTVAIQFGVEQHVDFKGFRTDVENALADFDVLAIPSRPSMREGLPLAALEGLAAGCIVVATPNSGIPEVIRHRETGFLVDPHEPDDLARTIVIALTLSETERRALVQRGLELVTSQFSIERQVRDLGSLYKELIRTQVSSKNR